MNRTCGTLQTRDHYCGWVCRSNQRMYELNTELPPGCTLHPPGQSAFNSMEGIEVGDQCGAEAFEEEEFARGSLPKDLQPNEWLND